MALQWNEPMATETNIGQIKAELRKNRWATACLVCAAIVLLLSVALVYFNDLYIESVGLNSTAMVVGSVFGITAMLMTVINVLLFGGALIAFPFCGYKGRSLGRIFASLFLCLFAWAFICPTMGAVTPVHYRKLCGMNMGLLGRNLESYAKDHEGRLPALSNWCDELVTEAHTHLNHLCCKMSGAVDGESSYAMNKSAAGMKLSDLPGDVVLLFETNLGRTESGRDKSVRERGFYQNSEWIEPEGNETVYRNRWNQSGGREILTTEHHNNVGCNILFAGGHRKFVPAADIDQLRWWP